MIQFASVVVLEISLATLGMLEDVLLKICGNSGKSDGDKGSGQSPLFRRAGSTVVERVATRSFFSLPTLTE